MRFTRYFARPAADKRGGVSKRRLIVLLGMLCVVVAVAAVSVWRDDRPASFSMVDASMAPPPPQEQKNFVVYGGDIYSDGPSKGARAPAAEPVAGAATGEGRFVWKGPIDLNAKVTDESASVAAAAQPAATAAAPAPPIIPAATDRKVIYNANMVLQVANRDGALDQIHGTIRRLGGFVQHATLEAVTFRVAPEKFEEALKSLAGMGQVLSREISSQDVTDQYVDYEIRIKSAEASLDRLRALLAKAEKTEDLLKIESDIRRLTEEIERMKGQLRVLANQVSWATITVGLQVRAIAQQPTGSTRLARDRFAWIQQVGIERVQDAVPANARVTGTSRLPRWLVGPKFSFSVPSGFVPIWFTGDILLTTTPEDYRMRLLMVDSRQGAEMDFWMQTLKAELGQRRGYKIAEIAEAALSDKALEGRHLRATINQGGEEWEYDLWLVRRRAMPERMAVIENACVAGQDGGNRDKIAQSVAAMQLRPSLWKAPFTQGILAVHKWFK
ncbi:MAG: DUF4349 domain-containing protein [Candidatus Sumerlaeia bacterium]